jgi:hypothetical protein
MVQELNYGRINMFWFLIGLARCGQRRFYFSRALPTLGKPFIFSFCLCLSWASHLFFHFVFARGGQAIYFFISPLREVGKPLFFFKHHKYMPFVLHGKRFRHIFCPRCRV